jgi:hypothetical protein
MPTRSKKVTNDLIHTALSLTGGYSEREHSIQLVPQRGAAMNFLEQAARAERLAGTVMDSYAADALMRYARECREWAARPAEHSTSPTHPVAVTNTAGLNDTEPQLTL